ncbi:MAG: glycosyltransferase family 39 protein [Planctomycetota bacterium]
MTEDKDTAKALPIGVLLLGIVLLGTALRTILMVGRGQVLEFDENFYLILARNLFSGVGYVLDLYPDIKYSPLFPLAAGTLSLLVGDLIWAGRIVSILAGALTCIPFYLLLKRLDRANVALIGSLFLAVFPPMQDFVMHSARSRDILHTGAEPPALFLMMWGVLFIVWSAKGGRKLLALGAGAAFGLAYLARPECLLYSPMYAAAIVALAMVADRASLRHRIVCALLCIAGTAVVASPYVLYLHKHTGRWTVSGKVLIPKARITGVDDVFDRNDWTELQEDAFALSPDNKHLESTHWGVSDYHREKYAEEGGAGWGLGAARVAANVRRCFSSVFWNLCPVYLWPFLVGGFVLAVIRCFTSRAALENEILLLVLAGPGAALALGYRILPRYLLPVCFLVIYYSAAAAVWLARRAAEYGDVAQRAPAGALAIVMGVHALWPAIYANEAAQGWLAFAAERGLAAEVISQHTEKDLTIMSFHPQAVFRSGRRWRTMPLAEAKRVFEYACNTKADALIFGQDQPPEYDYPFHRQERFRWVLFDMRPLLQAGVPLDKGIFQPEKRITNRTPKGDVRFMLIVKAIPASSALQAPKPER